MRGQLRQICLDAYDRLIGLELSEVAVDCCLTKAPCGGEKAGRNPVDRGKRGLKRSMAVEAKGIPLGAISAPANRHDSPLLVPTLEATSGALGALPEGASVHLDRGYDSPLTRERLKELGLRWEISGKGKPAPYWSTNRWVVERTSAWHNAHKKLLWCTERVAKVIDFWVAFSEVVIIVRRLIREAWRRYRWEGRPFRRPRALLTEALRRSLAVSFCPHALGSGGCHCSRKDQVQSIRSGGEGAIAP